MDSIKDDTVTYDADKVANKAALTKTAEAEEKNNRYIHANDS